MLNKSCLVVWPWILDAEWLLWEELLLVSPCLEPCLDTWYNAMMWSRYCEISKAIDL
jgi:hypothetical protein